MSFLPGIVTDAGAPPPPHIIITTTHSDHVARYVLSTQLISVEFITDMNIEILKYSLKIYEFFNSLPSL